MRTGPDGKEFVWGKIIEVHTFSLAGYYSIVEYQPWKPGQVRKPGDRREVEEETQFHVYVGGKDTNHGTRTLDGAVLTALCYANRPNANDATQTAVVLARALGLKGEA